MPAHLVMDGMLGVVVAASPWLFGFADQICWPHVTIGILEVGAAAMTETYRRAPIHYPNQSRTNATAS